MRTQATIGKLAALRAEIPGCTLMLCSDLRSGTVLAHDGDLTYPQEYLDALSDTARQALAPPHPGQDLPDFVLVSEISGLRLFSHHRAAPELGLTCLASFDADVAQIQRLSARFLSALSKERMT